VLPDLGEHGVGERLAGGMPPASTEVVLGGFDDRFGTHCGAQHLQALGYHLGTDPVTWDDGQPDGTR
jgi:hypothetical protein